MTLNIYQNKKNATDYIAFLNSPDGQFQQDILFRKIHERIEFAKPKNILDAACGNGWLTSRLSGMSSVIGCDSSQELLASARKQYPAQTFNEVDLTKALPYANGQFDYVVINMGAQDVESLTKMYENISPALAPQGKLLLTIPNPFYAFPVAVWKRGLVGKILGKKPELVMNTQAHANHANKKPIAAFPRPLEQYINEAVKYNFTLTHFAELKSETDSTEFNLQYQLFRYPLILMMEFEKNN